MTFNEETPRGNGANHKHMNGDSMSTNIVPEDLPEMTEAQRLLAKARALMLVALSRVGAFEDPAWAGVSPVLAEVDGVGGFNAYEARDTVGRAAEILRAALRVEVAEARAVEAEQS